MQLTTTRQRKGHTQQTNALLQPTSFCVNWRNERSLTRLPSLFLHSILQVLPWQTCMIKSAKQQGANMTRTGLHTQYWECRVWNKQKRDLNLLSQDHPAPVVCKNNIIPTLVCTKLKHQGYAVCLLCFRHGNLDLCVCVSAFSCKKNHHHYRNVSSETGPDHGWYWVLGDAGVSNSYSSNCCVSQTWRCTPYLICLSTWRMKTFVFWGEMATNY